MTTPPRRPRRVALVAHDARKGALADWAERHRVALAPHAFVATGTTGGVVLTRCPELALRRLRSGPLGGDQQVGALIAEGAVDALVFFIDPLTPHPHDVDVRALTRVAVVYDLPTAFSPAGADLLVAASFFAVGDVTAGDRPPDELSPDDLTRGESPGAPSAPVARR